jgi:TonB family protein
MVVVRNLSTARLKTSLILMSPVSLLFSSDEETSRPLTQALSELELAVEPCRDIFTVVEWLTSRTFDVIVADCDCGPEAAFLLKNARELKLNQTAFTLALTSGRSNLATGEDAPDLVLTKPLVPDQIKYALLTNDRFLDCMKAWIARGDFVHAEGERTAPSVITNEARQAQLERPSPMPPAVRLVEPSPTPYAYGEADPPLHLTFATLDRRLFRSMNRKNHSPRVHSHLRKSSRTKILWGSVLSAALISAGYIFGQPLQVQSVFASVATAYKQAEAKLSRRQSMDDAQSPDAAALAQAAPLQAPGSHRYPSSRVHMPPDGTAPVPEQVPAPPAETLQADARLDQDRLSVNASRVQIPQSLQAPPLEPTAVRSVSPRRSPSLLSQVEPVSLSENLSQELLLAKVQPSYPEQALKAGLQGAVVLQAWIGRDGSIRDLKLVDGSLLLGQAAVKAVRQWRYKPYLRNGVAVEAETYVTVNFRLP